jgi:hypothetical protein
MLWCCDMWNYCRRGMCAGTVHITIGSAGASLDVAAWQNVPWHEFGLYAFGYVRVSTANNILKLQYVLNESGEVADEVEIPSRF